MSLESKILTKESDKQKIVDNIRSGFEVGVAIDRIVSRRNYYSWLESDPLFKEAVEDAKLFAADNFIQTMKDIAIEDRDPKLLLAVAAANREDYTPRRKVELDTGANLAKEIAERKQAMGMVIVQGSDNG